jgi:hypothetical protein
MLKCHSVAVMLCVANTASHAAANCDSVRSQIEDRVRASGVTSFTLSTVEADARVPGKVVGTCDLGTKKIIYVPSKSPATAEPKSNPPSELIVTECKDGSVSRGGDCKK